jgi:hypothetical protein
MLMKLLPDQFAIEGSKDGRCWFAVPVRHGQGQTLERWRLDQTGELSVLAEHIPLAPVLPSGWRSQRRRRG